MKHEMTETLQIPSDVNCTYSHGVLKCSKDGAEVSRRLSYPLVDIQVKDGSVVLETKRGNKNQNKAIRSMVAHINNLFRGLDEPFTYELEAVNVHFPMTLKVEGSTLIINNFLGEKKQRKAKIVKNVKVDIKGTKITVTSPDREAAGQTAANFERATKVANRDRRIYQDGIFITAKPGREM